MLLGWGPHFENHRWSLRLVRKVMSDQGWTNSWNAPLEKRWREGKGLSKYVQIEDTGCISALPPPLTK